MATGGEVGHLSKWYYRLKAEQFLGVEPLSLLNHPNGEELMEQAWDAMAVENLAPAIARDIEAKRPKKK